MSRERFEDFKFKWGVAEHIDETDIRKIPQIFCMERNPRVLLYQFIRQSNASLPKKYISQLALP